MINKFKIPSELGKYFWQNFGTHKLVFGTVMRLKELTTFRKLDPQ